MDVGYVLQDSSSTSSRTYRLAYHNQPIDWLTDWLYSHKYTVTKLDNYNYIIIIEFNSGTIKIELDNTMWTVQPEQGRKG